MPGHMPSCSDQNCLAISEEHLSCGGDLRCVGSSDFIVALSSRYYHLFEAVVAVLLATVIEMDCAIDQAILRIVKIQYGLPDRSIEPYLSLD